MPAKPNHKTNAKKQAKETFPNLGWATRRGAGILAHPTVLPGPGGIGCMGAEAEAFINLIRSAGFTYWQICPLGPTGYGNSPYSAYSAFAGNPMLINLNALVTEDLLTQADVAPLEGLPKNAVDFDAVSTIKHALLHKAFENFEATQAQGFKKLKGYGTLSAFTKKHAAWLEPYGYFCAFKKYFNHAPWSQWPSELQTFQGALKSEDTLHQAPSVQQTLRFTYFAQYIFFNQWAQLKAHANAQGVHIIGDVPIFVAMDSADTWAHRSIFQIDARGKPTHVAGCPPDYFSKTGQFWGNPLYNWQALKKEKYAWWLQRLAINFELADVVRLDHFRGFYNYWEIPADAQDARAGTWKPGPGADLFAAIAANKPKLPTLKNAKLIAEDLGGEMEDVFAFREKLNLPGMAILQFAFDGNGDNLYLPKNAGTNTAMYTGTHDNDTTLGWYATATPAEQDCARTTLGVDGSEINFDLLRAAYKAEAMLAIVPLQDILNLGSEARFNTPGVAEGNWAWRATQQQLESLEGPTVAYLRELAETTGRL